MEDALINIMIKNGIVEDGNREVYKYAIQILVLKILHIIGVLGIAILLNQFYYMVIFLSLYSFIRGHIGGFHAKTRCGCFLISVMMSLIISISLIYADTDYGYIYLILNILFSTIIFFLKQDNDSNIIMVFLIFINILSFIFVEIGQIGIMIIIFYVKLFNLIFLFLSKR